MKHKRFVMLKRSDHLKRQEKEDLHTLMKKNEHLYKAYLLKEQILAIFNDKKSTFEEIKDRIQTWLSNALSNDLPEFSIVVKMISTHLRGILNYFRYGMTNAISEGFNTKINVIKRRAYGFKDLDYFILKIYQNSLRRSS